MAKKLLLSVGLSIVLLACSHPQETLPYFNSAVFAPEWVSSRQQINELHTIPSFNFINQEGQAITEKTVDGKIVVADFFFTSCPGICPRLTKSMGTIQQAFINEP